jgi:hypothetical protein
MQGIVQLLTTASLELKQMIMAAIYMHYGWEQTPSGQFARGKNSRTFRVPTEALRIKRVDYFERVYLDNQTHITLFDKGEVSNTLRSNFRFATMPQDKFFVIVGVQLRSADGAGTVDIATLNFDTVTELEVLNGLVNLSVNGEYEVEKEPVDSKFINGESLPNFFRLPEPVVWEPNESMKLELQLAKAFDSKNATTPVHKWAEVKLIGYLLEK